MITCSPSRALCPAAHTSLADTAATPNSRTLPPADGKFVQVPHAVELAAPAREVAPVLVLEATSASPSADTRIATNRTARLAEPRFTSLSS